MIINGNVTRIDSNNKTKSISTKREENKEEEKKQVECLRIAVHLPIFLPSSSERNGGKKMRSLKGVSKQSEADELDSNFVEYSFKSRRSKTSTNESKK